MQKLITTALAAAAFVSALSSVALANDPTTQSAAGGNDQVAMKQTAADPNSISLASSKSSTDQQKADADFHPDYSRALTPAQFDAAWNAEIERVFQPPHGGGG